MAHPLEFLLVLALIVLCLWSIWNDLPDDESFEYDEHSDM